MSQPNTAGGHPTSFNTNVNRAKTKKWVEAKSYSYDGDDWGEVDEYDEYGGHDEPEPAPKRTGFRQRGQTATQAPQEGYGARQDLCQSPVDTRQPFGQMGGPPSQQPYGGHSATNPQPQHQPALVRTNSFDQGDERHAFSAEGVQAGMTSTAGFNAALQPQSQTLAAQGSQHAPMYSSQQVPAQPSPGGTRLQFPNRSSMDGQARFTEQVQSTGGTFRGPAYLDQQRQGSRTHSMTSNTSSQDFHNRRDFSPSAMPPPLQTRGSPSPHGNPDSRSSSRHPPRKSSLSQDNAPTQPFLTQAPPTTMAKDPEEDVPAASDRVSSSAIKPLPFVRPADIYKRMNEEKEKERQSQESSRPSMDSLTGKPNDRPTLGKISSDNESAQRLKPTLDPVSERRSEYGIEGINVVNQDDAAERRPTTSKKFELPKRAPNTGSQSSTASIGPVLPDVSRVSGFGESFFGSGDNFTTPTMNFTNSASQLPSQEPKQTALEKDLQHQPSLGFTSAVHHAFDKAEDQVPPTPSSATNSTIGRSASGGTSAVSPIISRGPSAATDRLPRIEDVSTSTIVEEPGSSNSRPRSSGSPDTPRQLERKPSLSQGVASDLTQTRNDLPPLFVPGHRRDLSTPSPDNSPARMPALEANRQLRQPEEVELSAATPIEQGFNISSSSQNSAIARGMVPAVSKDSYGRDRDIQHASTNLPGKFDQKMSPISPQYARNRTDSSSSSRVRNIADQFESGSRPGSAHSTTPRASLLSSTTQREDGFDPPRPVADRMASFRPHLPGGWESSASITPTTGAGSMETAGGIQRSKQLDMSTTSGPISTRLPNRPNEGMSIMASDNNTSSIDQIKDASAEAFTAAAAAGTALAGAFASAVGMDQHDSSTASASDGQGLQRKSEDRGPASRASTNTAVHPEASRPSFPSLTDDGMSGAAPTPLPRNIQQKPAMDAEDPEYFPSPLSVHQGSSKRASQIEGSTPAKLQPTLPLLSTDLQSQQYESDRLRKEIVRELTPMSASEPTTAETDYSNYQSLATNPSVVRPGRESGVLPREYESYWNDENSDEEVSEIGSEPTRIEHAATAESQQVPSGVGESLRSSESTQPASPAPLPQGEPSQNRPHVLPHRFSWEQPLHDLSVDPNPIQEPAAAPTSEFLRSAIYPEGRSFQPQDGSRGIDPKSLMPVGQATIVNEISRPLDKEPPVPDSSIMTDQETEPIDSQKGLTDSPTGLEVAQPRGERVLKGPSMSSYDEKISNLGPQSSIGGMDQREEPEIPLSEASRSNDLSSTVPDLHLPSTEPAIPPKIPAFREIVALKTASERVRGFNDARQQFARLKVGLDDWVAQTVHELPEHADILAMSGRPTPNFQGHRPSPSRSKLGGLLPGGGQGGQQPYFQQYLNASPQSPAPSGSLQGGAAGSVSPQASSPSGGSGGKISGQQVQAKGKDLLHTAGVFGGKANVAAKGLFSKGKSKFRAASGAEKV